MTTSSLALALLLLSSTACDEKPAAHPDAPRPVKVTVDAARAAADPMFPLGTGESYYGGAVATSPLMWKTSDGTIVYLALVTTGKDDKARELGVLRAQYAGEGGKKVQDVQTFAVNAGIEHWAEVKPLDGGRVLFRFGEADAGPTRRNAALLDWDTEAKRVRLIKRWHGEATEAEPAWLTTGIYPAVPQGTAACAKVVARMVACGKDPKFREALFRNAPAAERADMEAHLDTHLIAWKKPAEVKSQCGRWASDEYVDTHFADPTRLARLAADSKMTCEYFGREVDDEGGLPRSAVDAKR